MAGLERAAEQERYNWPVMEAVMIADRAQDGDVARFHAELDQCAIGLYAEAAAFEEAWMIALKPLHHDWDEQALHELRAGLCTLYLDDFGLSVAGARPLTPAVVGWMDWVLKERRRAEHPASRW